MISELTNSKEFRRVLGHYPTGVCAITSTRGGKPKGMIVGSFTSVSLDPPLVAFLPDRRSKSWQEIEAAGGFCVNVLSANQQEVCAALTAKTDNKFEKLSYRLSDEGYPILEGAIAWIDCKIHAVHEAGDHYIAIGEVRALDVDQSDVPLLFHKGGYGSFVSAA